MFQYDENVETVDAYVYCIRQVAVLLGYGELQILEIFKNTLPNLRQAAETATKEKIDRQLSGQSFSAPFMKVSDPYKTSSNSKKGSIIQCSRNHRKNQ